MLKKRRNNEGEVIKKTIENDEQKLRNMQKNRANANSQITGSPEGTKKYNGQEEILKNHF